MPGAKTTRNHRLSQYERAQHAAFHRGVLRANGFTVPSRPARRGGRRRAVDELTDLPRPAAAQRLRGLLHEQDRTYTFSRDGTRVYGEVDQGQRRKKQKLDVEDSDATGDAVGAGSRNCSAWEPMAGGEDTSEFRDDWVDDESPARSGPLPSQALDAAGDVIESDSEDEPVPSPDAVPPAPGKRYQSSDDPISVWLPLQDKFLAEILVREHLEDKGCCVTCKRCWIPAAELSSKSADEALTVTDALYRCESCGDFLECKECCLKRHAWTPLHSLRVWRSRGFFERTTLRDMGLIYQLGHGGGKCAVPRKPHVVTVIHVNGVHRVKVLHCGCDRHGDDSNAWSESIENAWYPATTTTPQTFATFESLNHFRRLNVTAHVNVRDFVTCLERMTDPLGLDWVPDRYKSFSLMAREWTYLKRARRTGLGHLPGGIKSAPLGSAAVRCWACPRPGVNLPEGWRDVEENLRFKYQLFLGLDANFRMESKLRKKSKNKAYPILADGLGCIVPNDNYTEHLKNYVKEEDVSTCIAFAALMQKETRQSSGLRSTGVGGCICTRHEIIRPLGLGDLLKGERYANMDYVFWASVLGEELADILVSYDIGCQWECKLHDRQKAMPALLKPDSPSGSALPRIHVATPVWHGAVHEESCMYSKSLRYRTGAGMTDGEGVERVWSGLNPLATSTKEMHADGRHESIEDAADNHNFQKNLGLVALLPKRLEVAKEERAKQMQNFRQTSMSLSAEIRQEWEDGIKEWHTEDDLTKAQRTKRNPYMCGAAKDWITEADVRSQMQADELEAAKLLNNGVAPQGKSSMTMFLTVGSRLETALQRIRDMLKARVQLGTDRQRVLSERRTSAEKSLRQFRAMQERYMPGVRVFIEADEEAARARGTPLPVESVRLWMPSDIPAESRASVASPRLYEMEALLRRSQCSTSLNMLRLRLHTKRHFVMFRNVYMRGQRKTGRARTLIDSISDSVDVQARRYRHARQALVQLEGEDKCGEFRVLNKEDVRLRYVQDHDARAARRLAQLAGRATQSMLQGTNLCDESEDDAAEERGVSRSTLSWIWTAQGAPDDSDEYLQESVRVEWAKSYARKERWREEVVLGEEEMPRTLLSLKHGAKEWLERASATHGKLREVRGRRAYALRQAAMYEGLHSMFVERWESNHACKRKRARPDGHSPDDDDATRVDPDVQS